MRTSGFQVPAYRRDSSRSAAVIDRSVWRRSSAALTEARLRHTQMAGLFVFQLSHTICRRAGSSGAACLGEGIAGAVLAVFARAKVVILAGAAWCGANLPHEPRTTA